MAQICSGYSRVTFRVEVDSALKAVAVQLILRDSTTAAVEVSLSRLLRGVVPTPEVLFSDPSGTLVGVPALVTCWIDGTPLDLAARSVPNEAAELGSAVGSTLVKLSEVTLPSPGWLVSSDLIPEPRERSLAEGIRSHVRARLFDTEGGRSLPLRVRASFWRLVDVHVDDVGVLEGECSLVHGDFAGRNIVMRRRGGPWEVAAVLDWEFAYAGPSLVDVGHVLRSLLGCSTNFAEQMITTMSELGGRVPPDWPRLAWLLDLVSLTGPLACPQGHPLREAASRLIEESVSRNGNVPPWTVGSRSRSNRYLATR
ncbi:MAG TPA: phosphotransferase [Actinocrinis sp.]|jgi:aminoglycoside phosphotransferase (APT) family kinase protein|nr:phosphotransferase [Actinocrinis sp.]